MIPLCGARGARSCPIEARIFACVTYGPHLCVANGTTDTAAIGRQASRRRATGPYRDACASPGARRQVPTAGGQSNKERPAARRPRCDAQDRLVVAARHADPTLGAVAPRTA